MFELYDEVGAREARETAEVESWLQDEDEDEAPRPRWRERLTNRDESGRIRE